MIIFGTRKVLKWLIWAFIIGLIIWPMIKLICFVYKRVVKIWKKIFMKIKTTITNQ